MLYIDHEENTKSHQSPYIWDSSCETCNTINWMPPAQKYLKTHPVKCNIITTSESLLDILLPDIHIMMINIVHILTGRVAQSVLWVLHPQSIYNINYGKHLRVIYHFLITSWYVLIVSIYYYQCSNIKYCSIFINIGCLTIKFKYWYSNKWNIWSCR